MKAKFFKQAQHEYSPNQRLAAMGVEAVFFLILLPAGLLILGPRIDRWLGWPRLALPPFNLIAGLALLAAGGFFAQWSIYRQFTIGRGTPVPLMATQKLVIVPPYQYCRNPMALGTYLAYLGVAVLLGSPGAAGLVLLGAVVLSTYIKLVEEKEMEIRFGEEYRQYRRQTPFLIPRFRRNG